MHELGHAIGFHHEQTRPDRDKHVKILTENIEPHKAFNFNKYSEEYMNTYRVPYDYTSIMHYGQYVSYTVHYVYYYVLNQILLEAVKIYLKNYRCEFIAKSFCTFNLMVRTLAIFLFELPG